MKINYGLVLLNMLFVINAFSGQADSDNSNGRDSVSSNHDSDLRVEAFSPSTFDAETNEKTLNDKDEDGLSGSALLGSLVADLPREIAGLAWAHFDRTSALNNGSLTNEQIKMVVELIQKKKLDNAHNGDDEDSDEAAKTVDWFPIDGPISG